MILSDFPSRQKHDDSNPHEIIPISFNMHKILHEKYYNKWKSEKISSTNVVSKSTKSSGIKLLEVHGVSKNLDPNIQPEKQNIRPLKGYEISQEKPRICQGRAGMRKRSLPLIKLLLKQQKHLKKIPEASKIERKVINHPAFTTPVQSINKSNSEVINRRPMIKDIPFYSDPTYRPPPKPVRFSTSES